MTNLPDTKTASDWPVGRRCAWASFGIAFFLGLFDFIDRQVLASLFPFIKAEWQLTDTQLGSLVTILNVAIVVMVVPAGLLVDRWSRKKVLGLMAIVWSAATGACALAGSYSHLLAARFCIGAGEASYGPAASSLIAATFPKRLRTFALAASNIGGALGVPLGLVLGAYIASRWGWRHAFGIVALPGLIPAFAAFFLKDYKTVEVKDGPDCPPPSPVPDDDEPDCVPPNKVSTFKAMGGILTTPTLLLLYVGMALNYFFVSITMNWMPSYFHRMAGMPITRASGISAMMLVMTLLSLLLIGFPTDRLRKKLANASMVLMAACIGCAGLLYIFAFSSLTPGGSAQIAAIMAAFFLNGGLSPLATVSIVDVVHPGLRATAISIQLVFQNVLGMALGPVVAGAVSDRYDLGTAMTVLAGAALLACACFVAGTFTYRRDLARAAVADITF